MAPRFSQSDLDYLLGIAERVPHVLNHAARVARSFEAIGEKGRESYEESHWGEPGNQRTEVVDAPDPATGVAELGRLVAVEYLTTKRGDGESVYRHEFEGTLPVLGYTHEERPSGLVIIRRGSRYKMTRDGIKG
jgi:hypothetical protein